jgi:2-polyprenyl-6-methoxyphenol hydroxylase-like FAD-dependent oxidoreductase
MSSLSNPILVQGAGAAGRSLSFALKSRGIVHDVIDFSPPKRLVDTPVVITGNSMRGFERTLDAASVAKIKSMCDEIKRIVFANPAGKEICALDVSPVLVTPRCNLTAALSGCSVRYGATVDGVVEEPNAIVCSFSKANAKKRYGASSPPSPPPPPVRYAYAVACDGVVSPLRSLVFKDTPPEKCVRYCGWGLATIKLNGHLADEGSILDVRGGGSTIF